MAVHFIGIGEIICSNQPDDEIVTLGLGSCVALVVAHAPSLCGGMAHIALPFSKVGHPKEQEHPPAYYANLAVARLLESLEPYTGPKPRHLEVAVIGGASIQTGSAMAIGDKNVQSVLETLSRLNIAPRHFVVGGHVSRSVRLQVGSGAVWVREADAPERVLGPAQGYPFKNRITKAN